jgi:hypothetical protein
VRITNPLKGEENRMNMSAWMMLGFGIMVLLFYIAIVIRYRPRTNSAAEPANSHPGRVIPPGMPIIRALKEAGGDLRELQSQAITPAGGRLPFRSGQWLRNKLDGTLVAYVGPSGLPDYNWLEASVLRPYLDHADHYEPAFPREGEWWQKRPCLKIHPLPKDTAWCASPLQWCYTVGDYTSPRCGTSKPGWDMMFASERNACECGCLAPVNFGFGKGLTAFPRMRIVNDHAKIAERPRFRVGQWVRVRSTRFLAKLVSAGGEGWWSVAESVDQLSHVGTPESNLEPALPREGEWWESDHVGITREPFQWERQGVFATFGDAYLALCVDEGCLRPVNFGRGK